MPKTLFTRLCLTLVVLLLTFIAAIVLLLSNFDLNTVKPDLERQLSAQSNLEVQINGELRWQFHWQPSLSFAIAADQISATLSIPKNQSATDKKGTPFFQARRLELGVNLSALLQRQLKVSQMLLENVELQLHTNTMGKHNWEAIEFSRRATSPLEKDKGPSADQGDFLSQFVLKKLNIQSVIVHHNDELARTSQQLSIDSLQLMELNDLGIPFPIKLLVSIEQQTHDSRVAFNANGSIESQMLVSRNNAAISVAFQQLLANIEILQAKQSLNLQVRGDTELELSADDFKLESLALEKLTLEARSESFSDYGDFSAISLNISGFATAEKNQPEWLFNGDITAATHVEQAPPYTSNVDFKVSSPLSIILNSINADQQFNFDSLKGNLNQTQFDGNASLYFTANSSVNIKSNLSFDLIDLNAFLSSKKHKNKKPESAQASSQTTKNSALSASDAPLPFEYLDNISTELNIDIAKLEYQKLSFDQVSATLNIKQGNITNASIKTALDDGHFDFKSSLIRRQGEEKDVPVLTFHPVIQHLNLATLLNGLDAPNSNKPDELTLDEGLVDLTASLSATGESLSEWRKTLSGNSQLQLKGGVINNENLEYRVCQAVALARNTQLNNGWDNQTQLNTLKANFLWQHGIGTLTDLSGGLANVTIAGDGQVDLISGGYATELNAIITGNIQQQDSACAINEKYRHIAWPISCNGKLLQADTGVATKFDPAPECAVNRSQIRKVIQQLTRAETQSVVQEKLEEKLNDKLDPELKDLIKEGLDGLFR